jgi:TRAP-type mannitol/chloroaromatic compound transport system substrate-binding protein
VQVFGPGEAVPAFQVFGAVSVSTVEMGNTASYDSIGKDLSFAFGTAVPFGLNTRRMNAWLTYGGASTCPMIFTRPIASTACHLAIRPHRWVAGSARRSKPSTTSKV